MTRRHDMTNKAQWRGTALLAVLAALGVLCSASAGAAATGRAVLSGTPEYLALGGSASVGFQPTTSAPRGQRTDAGYANDLMALVPHRWPGLQLAQLGCPGATTTTFLYGGGHCRYPAGSQLAAADDFLRDHPATRLVTLDLGFNNIRPCILHGQVNQICVSKGLLVLRQQLPRVLASLRNAARGKLDMVGVGHYDPFVGLTRDRTLDPSIAPTSVGAVEQLNRTLLSIYARFGVPMANVSRSFDMTSTTGVLTKSKSEPEDVAKVCALTWMCAPRPYGPNLHPDNAGYRVIARAIDRALPDRTTHERR